MNHDLARPASTLGTHIADVADAVGLTAERIRCDDRYRTTPASFPRSHMSSFRRFLRSAACDNLGSAGDAARLNVEVRRFRRAFVSASEPFMIGRREMAHSNSQIERAERVAYRLTVVKNLSPETDLHIASTRRRLLNLMGTRLATLKERHQTSNASAAAAQMLDDQTDLVASMVVGDSRKPEARHLLDQMHQNASAESGF